MPHPKTEEAPRRSLCFLPRQSFPAFPIRQVISMTNSLQRLRGLMRSFPLAEGPFQTGLPFLTLYRHTAEVAELPCPGEHSVYLVVDGSIRLYTPSGILDYVSGQYSISGIDTPSRGYVQSFSEQKDFLALSIAFTLNDVVSVMLDLDRGLTNQITGGRLSGGEMARADRAMVSCACRFFPILDHPLSLDFMGKQLRRELIFYLLCGSCGSRFLRSIVNIRQAGEIYAANSWIKENFRTPFTVEELAEQRNMSVSLFHQKFKSAVGMGPLHCQKRLRLTEGRRLMLGEGKNVTQAALEVGYESMSQFVRDYKKMFGQSPKEDIKTLWDSLKE